MAGSVRRGVFPPTAIAAPVAHDHTHPPAHMRALVQEARSGGGRPVKVLLDEARTIVDPSFAAEALFHLAGDERLMAGDAGRALTESLNLLNKVERGWRQAEVVEEMARKAPKLRAHDPSSPHVIARFIDGLTDVVLRLPSGQALSKALQGIAKVVPADRRSDVVAKALANTGSALQDAKEVADASPASLKAIRDAHDVLLRTRLLAHVHARHGAGTLGEALNEARMVPDQDRVEVLRAIVASLDAAGDLVLVRQALSAVTQGPEEQARLLSALAARADRLGDRATALAWFGEAEALAAQVNDVKARAAIRSNLAQGLERSGEAARGAALLQLAQQDKGAATASKPTGPAAKSAEPEKTAPSAVFADSAAGSASGGRRHVLALVDTYEGGVGETHLRAIARAAPLCDAFGLDLALVGFPTDNLGQLMKQAMAETTIGDGGTHIQDLVAGGHVHLVRATHRQAPDLSSLGLVVATTPEPEPAKALDFPGCLAAARDAKSPRLVVLMGLGKKGLPASFLKGAPVHLELTGRRVHLETATAMGIIAERMRQLSPV